MSLNKRNLNKLSEILRQLPEPLPSPQPLPPKQNKNQRKLHRIETEEDPSNLFYELINASNDANIPSHMIKRLKEIENKQITSKGTNQVKTNSNSTMHKSNFSKETEELYTSFQMMLLEEEEEI